MKPQAARFAATYGLDVPFNVADFLSRIDVRDPSDCWPWKGNLLVSGYGRFHSGGAAYRAHRLAYELAVGPIPGDSHLDHTCHGADDRCRGGNDCMHRRCCNPNHLEPASLVENVMRGRSQAALNAGKSHCKRGHEFTPENTRLTAAGRRRCMECAGMTGRGQGSNSAAKTHCPKGHPYDDQNTRLDLNPDGSIKCRVCRACHRERARAAYVAKTKKK